MICNVCDFLQSHIVSTSFPQQEGTSPPEAAVEATPETTPIKVRLYLKLLSSFTYLVTYLILLLKFNHLPPIYV